MAETEYSKLTFSLPEDTASDKIRVFASATSGGAYAAITGSPFAYAYGETELELVDIDVTKYYKIQFYNSVTDKAGPLSGYVYGADWTDNTKPEIHASTNFDGAPYSTIQDVRDYTNALLTVAVATDALVLAALKRARAIIDLRVGEMNLLRFSSVFDTDVARRKYNAALHIVKESEINFALGIVYSGLSTNKLLQNVLGTEAAEETGNWDVISVGQSSISTGTVQPSNKQKLTDTDVVRLFQSMSDRYMQIGAALLTMLHPPTINISQERWPARMTPLERLRARG